MTGQLLNSRICAQYGPQVNLCRTLHSAECLRCLVKHLTAMMLSVWKGSIMDIPNLFPISKVGLEVPLSVVFLILRASVDRALPVHIYAPLRQHLCFYAFMLAVEGILTMAMGHKAVTQNGLPYLG